MNRRSFFKSLATAAAGVIIAPPSITFDRCWKRMGNIWRPEDYMGEYEWILVKDSCRLQGEVARALEKYSPWITHVEGGIFPLGQGVTGFQLQVYEP